MAATTYSGQTQTHIVTHQPPITSAVVLPPPQSLMNVGAIRGLGITQLVIGGVTLILGIVALAALNSGYWLQESGGGIWGGLWIITAGILGTISSYKPANRVLNGFHMAFNIVATVVAFFDGIFFAVGLGFYNNCRFQYGYGYGYGYGYWYDKYNCFDDRNAGRGIYGVLVFLMIAEFFVALVAAIYCCKVNCTCCGGPSSPGVIIQPAGQPNYVITSTTGGTTFIPQSHPQPQYGYPVGYMQQPGMVQTHPGMMQTQPGMMQTQPIIMQQQPAYPTNTNVTYTSQQTEYNKESLPPYSA